MLEKVSFLNEIKPLIIEKAFNSWFYSDDFVISKKSIRTLIDEIFDHLSLNNVYVNVLDSNFERLIFNDLTESIINFIFPSKDYKFLSNFKEAIRHHDNKERDRLMEFLEIFDFEKLRPLLEMTLKNKGKKGGRPRYDVVLMYKILFIKAYYNLSDEKTARRIRSDDVCQAFLNYPKKYPSKSTIWNFRDDLAKIGLSENIWKTFKSITMEGKYSPSKYVMQDATFYTADKGQKKKDYPTR